MFFAAMNRPKRLIYFSFINHVSVEELQRCREDLKTMLAEMPAGFRVLADLSNLKTMDVNCAPELGKVMELFDQKGVGMVVRVIPDATKDIGLNILSVFHYRRRPQTSVCKTMEEAAELLSL